MRAKGTALALECVQCRESAEGHGLPVTNTSYKSTRGHGLSVTSLKTFCREAIYWSGPPGCREHKGVWLVRGYRFDPRASEPRLRAAGTTERGPGDGLSSPRMMLLSVNLATSSCALQGVRICGPKWFDPRRHVGVLADPPQNCRHVHLSAASWCQAAKSVGRPLLLRAYLNARPRPHVI